MASKECMYQVPSNFLQKHCFYSILNVKNGYFSGQLDWLIDWLNDTYFIDVDKYKNITQNGLAQKRFTAYNKAPLLSLPRNSAQGQGHDHRSHSRPARKTKTEPPTASRPGT